MDAQESGVAAARKASISAAKVPSAIGAEAELAEMPAALPGVSHIATPEVPMLLSTTLIVQLECQPHIYRVRLDSIASTFSAISRQSFSS